jgi:import receptor subunit TOM70
LDPSYVQCYLKRASIYVEQGKWKVAHTLSSSHFLSITIENIVAAFKEIDDAIAINAADPDIYYHRGQSKSSRIHTRYANLSFSLQSTTSPTT